MTQGMGLEARVFKRSGGVLSAEEAAGNVRAELDRLAKQIRKKKVKSATKYSEEWYYNAGIDDAIELIREAKR